MRAALGVLGASGASRSMRALLVVGALALFLVGGCRRDHELRRLEARFAAAGMTVTLFHKVNPDRIAAHACRLGRVDGLHVMLCDFDKEVDAMRAANLGELFAEGALTGTWARRRDSDAERWVVLLAADRDKVDVDGQKATRVLASFLSPP